MFEPASASADAVETQPPAVTDGTWVSKSADQEATDEALVDADLLIEDISIDGMCGVY